VHEGAPAPRAHGCYWCRDARHLLPAPSASRRPFTVGPISFRKSWKDGLSFKRLFQSFIKGHATSQAALMSLPSTLPHSLTHTAHTCRPLDETNETVCILRVAYPGPRCVHTEERPLPRPAATASPSIRKLAGPCCYALPYRSFVVDYMLKGCVSGIQCRFEALRSSPAPSDRRQCTRHAERRTSLCPAPYDIPVNGGAYAPIHMDARL
jgi:hypothetical protein